MAKCLYSYRDYLPKHLLKYRLKSARRSTSGWRAEKRRFLISLRKETAAAQKQSHNAIRQNNRELKQKRFWETHVNRKWGLFLYNTTWRYQICLLS